MLDRLKDRRSQSYDRDRNFRDRTNTLEIKYILWFILAYSTAFLYYGKIMYYFPSTAKCTGKYFSFSERWTEIEHCIVIKRAATAFHERHGWVLDNKWRIDAFLYMFANLYENVKRNFGQILEKKRMQKRIFFRLLDFEEIEYA